MAKEKISATIDPERLAAAKRLTGKSNVSEVLDDALAVLIERELEREWLDAHPDDDLPGEVPVDLTDVPWDDK
jgi:hypothetical protein